VVFTTANLLPAVDRAFISRSDLVLELGLPDVGARVQLVAAALADLAGQWPALRVLADDEGLHAELGYRTERWAAGGCASSRCAPLARDPASLAAAHLLEAAKEPADW
jgi:hypothetical protein